MSSLDHSPARAAKARPGRRWPLLMSVREVAFEFGLSTRRIYQMIQTGELESIKIGKATRVPSESMLRLAGKQNAEAAE